MLRQLIVPALLALAMANAAAAPAAPPATTYHVQIDSTGMSGTGWLDFTFIPGQLPATGANASLRHVSGAFGEAAERTGAASGTWQHGITLGNTDYHNDFLQAVTLGGVFDFDVQFGGAFLTTQGNSGTTFGIDLLASDYSYLGNPDGHIAQVDLAPGLRGAAATLTAGVFDPRLATLSPVPEPSAWLMLLAGLGGVGLLARRRRAA